MKNKYLQTLFGVTIFFIIFTFGKFYFHIFESLDMFISDMFGFRNVIGYRDVFFYISFLGRFSIVFTLSLCFTLYFFLKKKEPHIYGLLSTVIAVIITSLSLKYIFQVWRPTLGYYIENGYSYPSFHAAISVGLYGYICYFLLRHKVSTSQKYIYVLCTVGIILLVGFSRVYLNVHFVSDVLGGYLLGTSCLLLGIVIHDYFKNK